MKVVGSILILVSLYDNRHCCNSKVEHAVMKFTGLSRILISFFFIQQQILQLKDSVCYQGVYRFHTHFVSFNYSRNSCCSYVEHDVKKFLGLNPILDSFHQLKRMLLERLQVLFFSFQSLLITTTNIPVGYLQSTLLRRSWV